MKKEDGNSKLLTLYKMVAFEWHYNHDKFGGNIIGK